MAPYIFVAVLCGLIIFRLVHYPESAPGSRPAAYVALVGYLLSFVGGFLKDPFWSIIALQTIYAAIFFTYARYCIAAPDEKKTAVCLVRTLWGFILSDVFIYLMIVIYLLFELINSPFDLRYVLSSA